MSETRLKTIYPEGQYILLKQEEKKHKSTKYKVTTQHKDQHPNHPELNLGGWMMQRKFSSRRNTKFISIISTKLQQM